MIELKNISKTYGKSTVKAVDSLSLTIPNGVIFGFLGPNGAGKTTTIKALSGALRLDEGSVAIDGISMTEDPLAAKQHIGLVNDNPELFNRLKAHEFLNFIGDIFAVPSDIRKERILDLAQRFSLSDVLTTSIGSMSRGMKQKLSIIASLIHDPENWILDEPMVGLDPQASFELKEIMRERTRAGKCVFFSTHVMEVAEKVCDQLAIINKGKIIFTGNMDDLRLLKSGQQNSLEELFLSLVDATNGVS